MFAFSNSICWLYFLETNIKKRYFNKKMIIFKRITSLPVICLVLSLNRNKILILLKHSSIWSPNWPYYLHLSIYCGYLYTKNYFLQFSKEIRNKYNFWVYISSSFILWVLLKKSQFLLQYIRVSMAMSYRYDL